MRVITGTARGRVLKELEGLETRPTTGKVKESLFSIIQFDIEGRRVLDLFAGTGQLGIEALSRGAVFALFVDRSLTAGRLIETNLRACLAHPAAAFVRLNLATAANLAPLGTGLERGIAFDLVFLDPPYRQHLADRVLPLLEPAGLLNPGAVVIVEEHALAELPEQTGALTLTDRRRYGETGLWIFRHQPAGN